MAPSKQPELREDAAMNAELNGCLVAEDGSVTVLLPGHNNPDAVPWAVAFPREAAESVNS